jgi:SagB-type dehydrogenase family enzyme
LELETFLYQLHFDTDKVFPPDWKVDWEDAPLPYKLYRNLSEIPLSVEVPFILKRRENDRHPTLEELGHFLWYVYGITQYSQSPVMDETDSDGKTVSFTQSLRRYVPSGGALYPNELYVYIKLGDAPHGIYHYDVSHHRLILLREGNYDYYLSGSLANSLSISDCFCTVFVSTVFWKNFYKYNNFSYRLQGLDAGVLIGQSLEVANMMGFSTRVCYQFLDRAVNHLLGLSEKEESVYAVIPLSGKPSIPYVDNEKRDEAVSASELCREIPELHHVHYNRSRRVIDYPILRKLNEESMFETTMSFTKLTKNHGETPIGTELVLLPTTECFSYDLAAVCRKRYSPEIDFTLGRVSLTQLSTLLTETFSFLYQSDLDNTQGHIETRVSLYGCFYNVEGIPNGAYSYDHNTHALRRIVKGDYRELLQSGLTMPNVNLLQVPVCMHIVGDKDHLKEKLGYRGYRIQQMEAGILIQRMLLVSTALGMGGHPLLGFDANQCDELYRLHLKDITSLIQIPVGPYRPRAWLRGSLHS